MGQYHPLQCSGLGTGLIAKSRYKFESNEARFILFFSCRKGLYAFKKQESVKMMFLFVFLRACELCKVNVNIHMIITAVASKPRMSDNQSSLLGETVSIS